MMITETPFWNDLIKGIEGPRKGGARIIVDAEDAKTGVGKTGLAIYIAELIAERYDYEIQTDDLTLSGAQYLKQWRNHPGGDQPSVIILDELGGAGAGNARRFMSTQNVELGNAWQLMRKKRIVSIMTLPHWSRADKTMRQQADFRLWCRSEPIGTFRPYKVGATFDNGNVMQEGYDGINRISFPNMDEKDDPIYDYLAELKDNLLDSQYFDADKLEDGETMEEQKDPEEVERETKISIAQQMRNNGEPMRVVAEHIGMSQSWVNKYTDNPEAQT